MKRLLDQANDLVLQLNKMQRLVHFENEAVGSGNILLAGFSSTPPLDLPLLESWCWCSQHPWSIGLPRHWLSLWPDHRQCMHQRHCRLTACVGHVSSCVWHKERPGCWGLMPPEGSLCGCGLAIIHLMSRTEMMRWWPPQKNENVILYMDVRRYKAKDDRERSIVQRWIFVHEQQI